LFKTLDEIKSSDLALVGGKTLALARLHQNGFMVPKAVCITTDAYESFVQSTGLQTRIQMEINRKKFSQMRWEEIWDAALRIRNLFLRFPLPEEMNKALRSYLEPIFKNSPVAVRSTAPGEDDRGSSFAGLHESYVNICGIDPIMDHVRMVWASLWSDAAMLYRREIGLDVQMSKMAVIVQKMINGDRSGVIFTRNPSNNRQSVIESVYGLNQGLVDGIIEPDRWFLELPGGNVISHVPAVRSQWMVSCAIGVKLDELPQAKSQHAPLEARDIKAVFEKAMASEDLFGFPQDMEWTFQNNQLYVLQSRPISSGADKNKTDERSWYLSLRRSLENLKVLRNRIEQELVVKMIKDAEAMERKDLKQLTDPDLAAEIDKRVKIYQNWEKIYWADFIPFAHGMRLFGQIYNDLMRPEDPFEFVSLLETSKLKSIERNRQLENLVEIVRKDPELKNQLNSGRWSVTDIDSTFKDKAIHFYNGYMDASWMPSKGFELPVVLVSIILKMADEKISLKKDKKNRKELEKAFLNKFDPSEHSHAIELLDLGRASFRLRDDDNMYLGRIERQMLRAGHVGKTRLGLKFHQPDTPEILDEIVKSLKDPSHTPEIKEIASETETKFDLRARQLIGQPAGPGIGTGTARVIEKQSDLGLFCRGEVLVCDAIEPNMTLVVPMAAAIIERRGGMLIHGAIIAREYGIPCVTGVPDATRAIQDGDTITVDGFLGIVTIGRRSETIH